MSQNAMRHPFALTKAPHTLADVLGAPAIGAVTGVLECARRADGGAAIVVVSTRFLKEHPKFDATNAPAIVGLFSPFLFSFLSIRVIFSTSCCYAIPPNC